MSVVKEIYMASCYKTFEINSNICQLQRNDVST